MKKTKKAKAPTIERNVELEKQIRAIERNRVLVGIQDEASDEMAQEIENLAVAAGFWWRCGVGAETCGFVNDETDEKCNGCGTKKGAKL